MAVQILNVPRVVFYPLAQLGGRKSIWAAAEAIAWPAVNEGVPRAVEGGVRRGAACCVPWCAGRGWEGCGRCARGRTRKEGLRGACEACWSRCGGGEG